MEVFSWFLGWLPATTLAPPAVAANNNARFGHSVLLNRAGPSPGMTLLLGVGIPGKDRVEMYAMGDSVQSWNLERVIDGPGNSRFGHGIHLRVGRLAIGAPERPVVNPTLTPPLLQPSGSVSILTRACNIQGSCGWSQTPTELQAVPMFPVLFAQNRLGESVHVVTPDRVVAGAPLYPPHTGLGQVRHYLLEGGNWTWHQGEPFHPAAAALPASEAGHSVSGDGEWLAIGQPGYPEGFGRVDVYAWNLDDTIFANGFNCTGAFPGCPPEPPAARQRAVQSRRRRMRRRCFRYSFSSSRPCS